MKYLEGKTQKFKNELKLIGLYSFDNFSIQCHLYMPLVRLRFVLLRAIGVEARFVCSGPLLENTKLTITLSLELANKISC